MTLSTKVYKKLLQVPEGKVTTYGDLAKAVGLENGQRAIGTIMKKNPFPVIIPCHRVVKFNGEIGDYVYGKKIKQLTVALISLMVTSEICAEEYVVDTPKAFKKAVKNWMRVTP